MKRREIDLNNFKKANSKVFSGREEGKLVREKLNLNQVDGNDEEILVIFPEDTISLNSSFFLGMFGDSIRSLKEEKFRHKYKFKASVIILKKIDEGISRALKNTSPFKI